MPRAKRFGGGAGYGNGDTIRALFRLAQGNFESISFVLAYFSPALFFLSWACPSLTTQDGSSVWRRQEAGFGDNSEVFFKRQHDREDLHIFFWSGLYVSVTHEEKVVKIRSKMCVTDWNFHCVLSPGELSMVRELCAEWREMASEMTFKSASDLESGRHGESH